MYRADVLADLGGLSSLGGAAGGGAAWRPDSRDSKGTEALGGNAADEALAAAAAAPELKQTRRWVEHLVEGSRALRAGLANSVLLKYRRHSAPGGAAALRVELERSQAQELERWAALRAAGDGVAPALDLAQVRRLQQLREPAAFAAAARALFRAQPGQRISLPTWWVRAALGAPARGSSPAGSAAAARRRVTTHQDVRDTERDVFLLNGQACSGAELTYEGVVSAVCELGWRVLHAEGGAAAPEPPGEAERAALRRFARAVLCTGNRTHSGGNGFEALVALLGAQSIITPESDLAEPVSLRLSLEPFRRSDGEQLHDEWGLVANISAKTRYMVKDPDDVERSILGLESEFSQVLALALPIPAFHGPLAVDDGFNDDNREDYKAWTSQAALADGHVVVSLWDKTGGAPPEELPGELPGEPRQGSLAAAAPERPAQLLPQDDAEDDLGELL
jgi:hypothetical protein